MCQLGAFYPTWGSVIKDTCYRNILCPGEASSYSYLSSQVSILVLILVLWGSPTLSPGYSKPGVFVKMYTGGEGPPLSLPLGYSIRYNINIYTVLCVWGHPHYLGYRKQVFLYKCILCPKGYPLPPDSRIRYLCIFVNMYTEPGGVPTSPWDTGNRYLVFLLKKYCVRWGIIS